MSNRHEISAANSPETRDRPFDAQVVKQVRVLAARYQIRIERDSRGYLGKVVDLPTIFGFGTSEEAALRTTREHLKWRLHTSSKRAALLLPAAPLPAKHDALTAASRLLHRAPFPVARQKTVHA